MKLGEQYIRHLETLIASLKDSQLPKITACSKRIGDCLMKGGMVYILGTGHSHALAEEMFYRAGGLVRITPMLDPGLMLHHSAVPLNPVTRRASAYLRQGMLYWIIWGASEMPASQFRIQDARFHPHRRLSVH